MSYKVDTTTHFDKEAKRLNKKYKSLKSDLAVLIRALEEKPIQGIHLGNNIYKIRLAISSKGKGKRGGARVMSYFKIIDKTVYLFSIYSKGDKDNISESEIQALIKNYL
jgi:mRNA-degrading endonuclease RelE of RelBE toxin-antitoxin system